MLPNEPQLGTLWAHRESSVTSSQDSMGTTSWERQVWDSQARARGKVGRARPGDPVTPHGNDGYDAHRQPVSSVKSPRTWAFRGGFSSRKRWTRSRSSSERTAHIGSV